MTTWKEITRENPPRILCPFLLEWDNGWVRAVLYADGVVTIEWHCREYSVFLNDIKGRMWLEIPKYTRS